MKLKTRLKYAEYEIKSIDSDGSVNIVYQDLTNSREYIKEQKLIRCKLNISKKCTVTGRIIVFGSYAYRPTTNGQNRGHRMCAKELNNYLTKFKK